MSKPMSKTKVVGHLAEKVGTPKKTAAMFFDELFKLAVREAKGAAGNYVPDLRRVQQVFHSRHLRVAGLDPRLQRFRRDLVPVHTKRSALGHTFQPGTDFFLGLVRKMADSAFLLEYLLASRCGSPSGVTRCFLRAVLRWRVLRQHGRRNDQNCGPKYH